MRIYILLPEKTVVVSFSSKMATITKSQLVSELSKWKKDELIEYIVNKRVPNNVKTNNVLCAALDMENTDTSEESQATGGCSGNCQTLKAENENIRHSNLLMQKLQHQLEKRTEEQELLIGILRRQVGNIFDIRSDQSESEVIKTKENTSLSQQKDKNTVTGDSSSTYVPNISKSTKEIGTTKILQSVAAIESDWNADWKQVLSKKK